MSDEKRTDPVKVSRPRWSPERNGRSNGLGGLLGADIPPAMWLIAAVLGSAGSGGMGSMLGGQQAAADMARLEEKVDALDEKMTQIRILIAAHHGHDPDRP